MPNDYWTEVTGEGCGTGSLGTEIHTYYAYDSQGNRMRTSVPQVMLLDDVAVIEPDWGTVGKTIVEYDGFGRPLTQTDPNGEKLFYDYVGRATSLTRQDSHNGQERKTVGWEQRDALGFPKFVRTYDCDNSDCTDARWEPLQEEGGW